MKYFLASFYLFLIVSFAHPAPKLEEHLANSVTIQTGPYSGSGVVFLNGKHAFVWTDAHVVSSARETKTVVEPASGQPKVVISYDDVWVLQEEHQDGRKVGEVRLLAKIIRFGEKDDVAILKVYKKDHFKSGAVFAKEDYIPSAGRSVWHVGSARGKVAANAVSDGVIAKPGSLRLNFSHDELNGIVYDVITCTAHHGCSGGGVFDKKTGKCIGLVTEFIDSAPFTHGSFAISPSRRLHEFAKRTKSEFAINSEVAVPNEKEISSVPVTDGYIPLPKDWPGAK